MGDISTDYYEFQIVNWYCTDVEVEPNEDDDDNECVENQLVEKYIIKLFGVDATGKSIGVSVCDFTPHFYVKIERPMSPLDMDKFKTALRQHMGYMGRDNIHIDIRGMSKKDFWGFSNNKMFHFIRLCFDSFKAMKAATRAISSHKFNVIGLNQRKFKLYESNIEPFLRFAHIKNIQPAGWVRIPKKKTTMGTQILPCKCELDLETKWKNIESVEKDEIAPLLVASFDLECMSCDGDFPVPIKNYQKIATEIYNLYHDTKSKSHDSYELKEAMHLLIKEKYVKGLVVAKSVGGGDGKKNTVELLQNVWLKYQDHVMSICKGDTAILEKVFAEVYTECFVKPVADGAGPENILRFHGKLKKDGTSGPVLRKSMVTFMNNLLEKNKMSLAPNINVEEKIEELLKLLFGDKDGIITILTRLFDRVLVPLEGDEIIQIGTTFHRYGQSECSRKIIFSLGTCDQLADNIEVVEFDNEADMILAWTDLINDSNPDIITGYNIFGFDFNYIYNRALELGCQKDFCKIGRLHGHSSLFKTAKLSSSALGDNIMKFIDMEGRTLIDLMKVVQRDHKLDSFKLDNVASHFMGMNKNDVSPQDIFRLYRGDAADRARVADYCVQDCALCNKLMMKLEIVANNVGMANVCSVPLSWIFMRGQGVKIFSLVAKECKNMGYLIPVIAKGKGIGGGALFSKDGDVPEEEDAGYEGAIVLEPKTGIYTDKPITIFDYASLYPSSMISENISHDSIVLDEKYDNLPGVTYLDVSYDLFEKVGDEKRKIGEQVCRYVQPPDGKKGIIPNILMHLLKQRKITRKKIGMQRMWFADGSHEDGFYTQGCGKIFKIDGSSVEIDETLLVKKEDVYNTFQKAVLDGLQLAYKITANSLYGQVGASTSPIYMKDLAASTTATGRKMIMLAKDFMEKEYKAEIVYGDTDSLFATFPHINTDTSLSRDEVLQKTYEVALKASEQIKPLLKKPHDLEYEKIFYPMILFSKKRYCANKYEHDLKKFKQISMGIALKRRDNANIVKKIYGGIIDIILNEHDVEASIKFLRTSLEDLLAGKYPLEDFIITKTLKGHYKDPSRIAHKVLAERIKERTPGNAPQVNDRIPYAYIEVKNEKCLQGERIEHPDYIREKKLKVDYSFYLTNQIQNPVLQLYALILEQLPKYRLQQDYWKKTREALVKDGKSRKFIDDKIADMREMEARKLLCEDVLNKMKLKKTGQRQLTDFW